MTTYVLILFVIVVALAPLLHFVPSKRQRHSAMLREYAALNGLFVELRNLPESQASRELSRQSPRQVIYYGKRLPLAAGERIIPGTWLAREGDWCSVHKRLPVPHGLAELAAPILAAGVDPSSCGVYWEEASTEEGVDHIRDFLESWSSALIG